MEKSFIEQLGFDGVLIDANEVSSKYPDYADIVKTGAEKMYFSGGKPSVLFMSVPSFDATSLAEIAKVQHNAWNYQRVLLLYVTSDTEIRIYNCYGMPANTKSLAENIKRLNKLQLANNEIGDDLTLLCQLFSRMGVDSGALWTSEQVKTRQRIRKEQRVDAYLIKCMIEAAKRLEAEHLSSEIIHALLIRSLFILFLEDKGAAKEAGLYDSIKSGTDSYFAILEDKDATYRLFAQLQEQFNGNVTMLVKDEESKVNAKHLSVIHDCFFDGDFEHQTLFEPERLFNFEIIHIGLISDIYENFLGELRHKRGQFYTPFSLADMILTEVLPTSSEDYDYPILDPACGSGIFLVEGYKRLIKRWQFVHKGQRISFETLVELLRNNIYGIEVDETAIRVAAFSLYLTLIDHLDPKTLWNSKGHRLPYLIYNPSDESLANKQGRNLWCRNTISEVDASTFPKVRLVVGNPPYGTKSLPQEITEYCKKYRFANEYVLPFMHKATQFCPDGIIALVFSAKVLFNTSSTYNKFRKWLFSKNTVNRLDNLSIFRKASSSYGGSLFSGATCPVCVIYYSQGTPDDNSYIKYCSPKTFIKSNLIDGLLIDESDIKYLPVRECQKPNTKIWKVAAWGNYYGYQLINRLSSVTLGDYFKANGWLWGRGVNAESSRPDFIPSPLLSPEYLTRYKTDLSTAKSNTTKKYRSINQDLFNPPFVAFKQGQTRGEIACSLFEERVYFTTMAFAINGGSVEDRKILTAYLNSRLAKYFMFLITSSWGVERETVNLDELLAIPSPIDGLSEEARVRIVERFDRLYKLSGEATIDEISIASLEKEVNDEFEKALGLSDRDSIYVRDTLAFHFDIFRHKMESSGYLRALPDESKLYAQTLTSELTSLLKNIKVKASATYYAVGISDPLQLVVLNLKSREQTVHKGESKDFRDTLHKIDGYMTTQHSDSVYLRKTLKYYDGNMVYVIKPNQKRFWSQMQAYDDAASIINDLLNM